MPWVDDVVDDEVRVAVQVQQCPTLRVIRDVGMDSREDEQNVVGWLSMETQPVF